MGPTGNLQVGVMKAIELAHSHDLKFLPVHHMEAHALVARQAGDVPFPFLCLLISGGHNMLLVAHDVGDYTLLGSTLDDALGQFQSHVLPSALRRVSVQPSGIQRVFRVYVHVDRSVTSLLSIEHVVVSKHDML